MESVRDTFNKFTGELRPTLIFLQRTKKKYKQRKTPSKTATRTADGGRSDHNHNDGALFLFHLCALLPPPPAVYNLPRMFVRFLFRGMKPTGCPPFRSESNFFFFIPQRKIEPNESLVCLLHVCVDEYSRGSQIVYPVHDDVATS
jgi:hypothetical protein